MIGGRNFCVPQKNRERGRDLGGEAAASGPGGKGAVPDLSEKMVIVLTASYRLFMAALNCFV